LPLTQVTAGSSRHESVLKMMQMHEFDLHEQTLKHYNAKVCIPV